MYIYIYGAAYLRGTKYKLEGPLPKKKKKILILSLQIVLTNNNNMYYHYLNILIFVRYFIGFQLANISLWWRWNMNITTQRPRPRRNTSFSPARRAATITTTTIIPSSQGSVFRCPRPRSRPTTVTNTCWTDTRSTTSWWRPNASAVPIVSNKLFVLQNILL